MDICMHKTNACEKARFYSTTVMKYKQEKFKIYESVSVCSEHVEQLKLQVKFGSFGHLRS